MVASTYLPGCADTTQHQGVVQAQPCWLSEVNGSTICVSLCAGQHWTHTGGGIVVSVARRLQTESEPVVTSSTPTATTTTIRIVVTAVVRTTSHSSVGWVDIAIHSHHNHIVTTSTKYLLKFLHDHYKHNSAMYAILKLFYCYGCKTQHVKMTDL